MNFALEIFDRDFGQLDPSQKVFLVAVILGCAVLAGYSLCRLLRYSRKLESVDSQLAKLSNGPRIT